MKYYEFRYNTLSSQKLSHILVCWADYFEPDLLSYVKNPEAYAEKITRNALVIEAYNNNNLAGLLAIYLNTKQAYITHIAVKPEFQRTGLGKKMIETAVKKAREKGFKNIQLECFDSSLDFYLKQNFQIISQNGTKYLLCLSF